jgi:hypothetical protein
MCAHVYYAVVAVDHDDYIVDDDYDDILLMMKIVMVMEMGIYVSNDHSDAILSFS